MMVKDIFRFTDGRNVITVENSEKLEPGIYSLSLNDSTIELNITSFRMSPKGLSAMETFDIIPSGDSSKWSIAKLSPEIDLGYKPKT